MFEDDFELLFQLGVFLSESLVLLVDGVEPVLLLPEGSVGEYVIVIFYCAVLLEFLKAAPEVHGGVVDEVVVGLVIPLSEVIFFKNI